jgi:hypothetical protein
MADDLRGRIAGAVMVVARMEARKEVLRRDQVGRLFNLDR